MKVRPSVKMICKNCKLSRRGGKLICTCTKTAKHKQRQG